MSTYTMGYKKGRNRSISVSAETDSVAKAAAELLNKAIRVKQKEAELVKALTDAATRWNEQADSFIWKGPDGKELERYYRQKARAAIEKATAIVNGEG